MSAVAIPLLIVGVMAAHASTQNPSHAARLETLAGVLVAVGLGVLGFCLPIER